MTFEELKERQGPLPDGFTLDNIDDEAFRTYHYLAAGTEYRIRRPIGLIRRDGGTTHRIIDENGTVHCCPIADAVITWKTRDPLPPVRF